MFEKIETYILKEKSERIKHIDLFEKCIEIGGIDSREYRALLAHYVKTTIPSGYKIILCHKCNNGKCSNPKHLYWGTPKENTQDSIENGTHVNGWKIFEEKIGKEEAIKFRKEISSKGGKAKRKRKEISLDQIENYKKSIIEIEKNWGWIQKVAKQLKTSHTTIRRFINEHMKEYKI